MFPLIPFFSFFIILLSAAALAPASDSRNPSHPFPIQHVKRDLTLPSNLSTITIPPFPPSILNTTNAIEPHCYPADPHSPLIHPSDCHTALYTLLASPNAMILRRWDRSSALPVEHVFQTCSIIIARASAGSDDLFQEVLIAHAAALLVQSCVTAGWGYQGGKAWIGIRGDFVVYLSASDAGDGMSVENATA